MRAVAILTTYNEERVIATCLEHLIQHGFEVHLTDNCSTDRTVEIAERYLGHGLIGIDALPRKGEFSLRRQLKHKEEVCERIDADWFLHLDADEIRLPPRSGLTLAETLATVDKEGYNAVNFLEYTFIPTQEAPDHDHPDFIRTMRWYYPFVPRPVHHVKAWKRQPGPVDLASSGGHRIWFPGQRIYPESFILKHYQFLSIAHARRKYLDRHFEQAEVDDGWHGWRTMMTEEWLVLPHQDQLRTFISNDDLDASSPWKEHWLPALLSAQRIGDQAR